MAPFFFDDALVRLVETLSERIDRAFVEEGVVLRDASGRLTFVANRPARDESERQSLGDALIAALGPYARADRPISFKGDGGADPVLESPDRLPIQLAEGFCRLVDRRIVGSGWLDTPLDEAVFPPRVVFASLKGGVGRSTALAVAAADLARRNRNILIIDLDLEAPGLGHLLLGPEEPPRYGVLDYLVEDGLGGVPDALLPDFIASSLLTSAGGGRVDVLPALGQRSFDHPENVLPKLSRAMLEDVGDGGTHSVAEQISAMITRITRREQYDAVFIDSRAGLAELAAPAVLGLGATVLLFGTAQQQTLEGYRALFAALRLLAQRDKDQGRGAEWRTRLRPVYAKAGLDNRVAERFTDDLYELYSEYLYDSEEDSAADSDPLRFARDDPEAPHWPLVIPFNQSFIDFDPCRTEGQLLQPFYEQTYRSFLSGLDAAMGAEGAPKEPEA
ncbi:KGGVGR-motif variant AAA ATPase [Pararhodospirillum oryzae]|uniref:CobQ/CobB/MinD/ParA nucleotide binding domain-containing protein n=1 Tax=Pararhodospirillum oryzae TaxID=478448 RepID=A0A512H4B9_9PROT|nr:hypothetical protein [Pararhodospirillum oryzae]GEO80258.1 hypothetical protein ROR02_03890 [Pararhodospirillum oryzae]